MNSIVSELEMATVSAHMISRPAETKKQLIFKINESRLDFCYFITSIYPYNQYPFKYHWQHSLQSDLKFNTIIGLTFDDRIICALLSYY